MDSVPNFEDILILGPVSSTCRVVSLYCECVHPSRHLAEYAVSIATVIGGLIANACHSCSLSSVILSTHVGRYLPICRSVCALLLHTRL